MDESDIKLGGTTAPGFEGVQRVFVENFVEHGEVGASLGVYVDGQLVVDLFGGTADVEQQRPWSQETVGIVYSATKGAAAMVMLLLAQRGELDLRSPVSEHWPDFGRAEKQHVTILHLLSHQAGLPYVNRTLTRSAVLSGTVVSDALAEQRPIWEPGTEHGYHAMTYGWLLGGLVRHLTGESLGRVFARDVATPLDLDFFIGLPETETWRVAALLDPLPRVDAPPSDPELRHAYEQMKIADADPRSEYTRTLTTNGALPTPDARTWNDPSVYRAEIPTANGITNGPALAKLYASTVGPVDGVRLLTAETVDMAREEQVSGPDRILFRSSRFGIGFQLPTRLAPLLSPDSFGHSGVGGFLGFADVGSGVGFGYVPNQLGRLAGGDVRAPRLIAALRDVLDAR